MAKKLRNACCKVRAGKKGRALKHLLYIMRLMMFGPRPDAPSGDRGVKYNDLIDSGYANLPSWAKDDPQAFFKTSDLHERANGTSYRGIMFALPRGLPTKILVQIIREFCECQFSDRHAYVWALHNPKAAIEGGDQPHVHIMFCERIVDARNLGPDRYFKTWRRHHPDRGGYRKAGWELNKVERRRALIGLRKYVADLINTHLEAHEFVERFTHESFKTRGLDVEAEKKTCAPLTESRKRSILESRELRDELISMEESARAEHDATRSQEFHRKTAHYARLRRDRLTATQTAGAAGDAETMVTHRDGDVGGLGAGGHAHPAEDGEVLGMANFARAAASVQEWVPSHKPLTDAERDQFAMFRPKKPPSIEKAQHEPEPDSDDEGVG